MRTATPTFTERLPNHASSTKQRRAGPQHHEVKANGGSMQLTLRLPSTKILTTVNCTIGGFKFIASFCSCTKLNSSPQNPYAPWCMWLAVSQDGGAAGPELNRPVTKLDSPFNVASIRQKIIKNFEARGRFQVTKSHDDGRTEHSTRRREEQGGGDGNAWFLYPEETPPDDVTASGEGGEDARTWTWTPGCGGGEYEPWILLICVLYCEFSLKLNWLDTLLQL